MKNRNHNAFRIFKNIVKVILLICSVVAVIAGVFDQIGQAKERREAKKTGKSIHKMNGPYEQFFKRPLDAFLSAGALIVLSLAMAITAVLVKLKLGSPVLFTQERTGLNNKPFKLFKFRTMTDEKDDQGNLLPDEDRLTSFGKKLRATSIDELPSLINVIKGEMAVIGPRPLPTDYIHYYTDDEIHRHDVRPGITGLAQVNGRNYVTWEDKFSMDNEYANNVSAKEDAEILGKTVAVVFEESDIETASVIEHDGVVYRPLNVERKGNELR